LRDYCLEGVEALNMMRKRQVKRLDGRDPAGQAKFFANLFEVDAKRCAISPPSLPLINLYDTTIRSVMLSLERQEFALHEETECERLRGREEVIILEMQFLQHSRKRKC
jgi:hypothetical protein